MIKFKKYDPSMFKSDEFEETLFHFSTNNDEEFANSLVKLGMDSETFTSVALSVMTSKTASDMRERVVARFLGFSPKDNDTKHGFDGFNDANEPIEIKPKDVAFNTENSLDLSYNINDYTLVRLEKDKLIDPHYALAGFIDAQLVYIITFRFNDEPEFANSFEMQIKETLEKIKLTNKNRRTIGRISINNIPLGSIKVYTVLPKEDLISLKCCMHHTVFDILMNHEAHGPEARYVKSKSCISDMFG